MPWITFTSDHVKKRISARELEHYVTEAQDDGEDPDARIEEIVAQVGNEVRGKIRANPGISTLGPDGTLPDSCIASAALVARQSMITQVPLEVGMVDPRRDEYRDARKFIDSIPTQPANLFEEPASTTTGASICYGGNPMMKF